MEEIREMKKYLEEGDAVYVCMGENPREVSIGKVGGDLAISDGTTLWIRLTDQSGVIVPFSDILFPMDTQWKVMNRYFEEIEKRFVEIT